jgi:hypothetical protein
VRRYIIDWFIFGAQLSFRSLWTPNRNDNGRDDNTFMLLWRSASSMREQKWKMMLLSRPFQRFLNSFGMRRIRLREWRQLIGAWKRYGDF